MSPGRSYVYVAGQELLDIRHQELEELTISALDDLPLLGPALGRLQLQRCHRKLEITHLAPRVGADSSSGAAAVAHQHLDHAPIGEDQRGTEEECPPHPEA